MKNSCFSLIHKIKFVPNGGNRKELYFLSIPIQFFIAVPLQKQLQLH